MKSTPTERSFSTLLKIFIIQGLPNTTVSDYGPQLNSENVKQSWKKRHPTERLKPLFAKKSRIICRLGMLYIASSVKNLGIYKRTAAIYFKINWISSQQIVYITYFSQVELTPGTTGAYYLVITKKEHANGLLTR